jgi:glutamine synthetase
VNIEGETTADLASTMVLPAAVHYMNELISAADGGQALGVQPTGILKRVADLNDLINDLTDKLGVLVEQNAELGGDTVHSKSKHMRENVIPAMAAVRVAADRLERIVPDDLWPLPRYRDMLFVK